MGSYTICICIEMRKNLSLSLGFFVALNKDSLKKQKRKVDVFLFSKIAPYQL